VGIAAPDGNALGVAGVGGAETVADGEALGAALGTIPFFFNAAYFAAISARFCAIKAAVSNYKS
jgi:hypothetical protein